MEFTQISSAVDIIKAIINNDLSPALSDLAQNTSTIDEIISSEKALLNELIIISSVLDGSTMKGDKGDNGSDGLTAYQIALNNGFIGTEQEWLTSLIPPIPPCIYDPILCEATADFVVTSVTPSPIEGLSYAVKAGEVYEIMGAIEFLSTVATTGVSVQLNSPSASVNFVDIDIPTSHLDGIQTIVNQFPNFIYNSNVSKVVGTGVTAINQYLTAIVRGFIVVANNGNITLSIGTEVANSTVRFLWGNSKMILRRVK
ncbi:hypothetical protein [Sulfuricurvum sp.]|uniref:hypothetical protein n=1 Tax=Sulfuricurvum sp. TaxID=2025608 RepID=UPI002639C37F|nr:hypothetical protein [Sulfuricurvum sp.]MDD4949647.1 hypothetical protein [Sulfuricurvum sp.]